MLFLSGEEDRIVMERARFNMTCARTDNVDRNISKVILDAASINL